MQEAAALQAAAGRFAPDAIATVERVAPTRPDRRFPAPEELGGMRDMVIVGGGQAGLSASFALSCHGVDHVVLERDRIACSWRDARWDSFCLVTPNFVPDWSWVRLPLFDGTGYPEHLRGVTTEPGVCVPGLPWLHTWGSGRLAGNVEDAQFVADHIAMALAEDVAPARSAA